MPPRSLLLNVSITAKEIDRVGEKLAVESVKELDVGNENVKSDEGLRAGRQERHDSAASIQTSSSFHNIASSDAGSPIAACATQDSPISVATATTSPAVSPPIGMSNLPSWMSTTNAYTSSCGNCNFSDSSSGSGLYRCSRCKKQRYCSKKCQRSDWPAHKTQCFPAHLGFGAEIDRPNTPALSPGQF